MKTKSPGILTLASVLACSVANPYHLLAQSQSAPQRAGEVSRVIPAVNIARGSKSINASAKTVIDWQDVVNTLANARARVSLDDGSILNVGSDSSLHIVKHDAGAQQTTWNSASAKCVLRPRKSRSLTENSRCTLPPV